MSTQLVHCFEEHGLGKAPFTCIGYQSTRDRIALNRHLETCGQIFTTNMCGGTCDYCGTAIFNVFYIQSSDGKEFKVGCDCVLKTGDTGLKKYVNGVKKELTKIKNQNIKQELSDLIADEERRNYLGTIPHPLMKNRTMLDYMEYCLKFGGASSHAKCLRLIKKSFLGQ